MVMTERHHFRDQVLALMELWPNLNDQWRNEYLLELWQQAKTQWPSHWTRAWVGHPLLGSRLHRARVKARNREISPGVHLPWAA